MDSLENTLTLYYIGPIDLIFELIRWAHTILKLDLTSLMYGVYSDF